MGMNLLDAMGAIGEVAEKEGVSVSEVLREIDLAIAEAMQSSDPLVQARWASIPHSGDRPTALEFVAYMRGRIYRDVQ